MKRREFISFALLSTLALDGRVLAAGGQGTPVATPLADGKPHAFTLRAHDFVMDGQPFQIRSGEMHPARIPRSYWHHRIRMAKAMGLNTIALYIMWNQLEGEPGVFDLSSGNRDFAAFIQLCQAEGMWVYLRPGPYVCAEWDMGGLPAYLLRKPGVKLRDRHDADYMAGVQRYIAAVAPKIAPLMAAAGGPVLMLQIENEYSSFAADVGYLEAVRDLWRSHGIDGPFSLSETPPDFKRRHAYLPDAALGLDGAEPPQLRAALSSAPHAPVWVGESYPGWLTHWGEREFARKSNAEVMRKLIAGGYSFNLYVVHGGTNFGLSAGANADDDGSNFQPVITSYDYAAPIDECGDPTPAYHALRAIIGGADAPALPPPCPKGAFADVLPAAYASLWDNLPAPVSTHVPAGNEALLRQNQGIVVYRKTVKRGHALHIDGVRDYAVVHVDQNERGHISRVRDPRLHSSPTLHLAHAGQQDAMQLEILVDSFGHINFGPQVGDAKGLVGSVQLDGTALRDWQVYGLPLDEAFIAGLKPTLAQPARPGLFFKANMRLHRQGDVYIDLRAWNKGYVWVNGHLLGRYWHIGPQQCLYCPAEWLSDGDNQILILDLHQTTAAPVRCASNLAGTA
ncbi:beta-galactosidase [Dyella acidiphila]|uniref:Beta-galactosidase n=1 Tax=Dyella acidiphila TaxID=2775866 RepID=A0ABR9GCT0_9GAMM|nr:beta-galactosidase [Dyella acidiphila]MBE1161850.1 beta-galactosidase [Dyella acidiphila]